MEKLKNKKIRVTLTFGAVAAAVFLFQGVMPRDARESKIVSISPNQGPAGTQVVISGSGFTTSIQGIVGTRVKNKVLDPGNYILVKDEAINQPVLSPDGKTLMVRLDLVSQIVKRECEEKFSKKSPQPCKVPVKVVNAYGKPSNEVQFTFTGREYKKLTYSLEKLPMPSPAVVHPIGTWRNGEELMRVRVNAPATNEQAISGIEIDMATYVHADSIGVPCSYFYPPSGGGYVWVKDLNTGSEYGGVLVGGSSPLVSGACTITFNLFGGPLVPGTHRDFAITANMFVPPATAKTFTLLAGAMAWYDGPGYYTIDNGNEEVYPGLGVASGIESDPIQIVIP